MYGSQPTNTVYYVQQIWVVAFAFTGPAPASWLISCVACGFKKAGQHWSIVSLFMHIMTILFIDEGIDIYIQKYRYRWMKVMMKAL